MSQRPTSGAEHSTFMSTLTKMLIFHAQQMPEEYGHTEGALSGLLQNPVSHYKPATPLVPGCCYYLLQCLLERPLALALFPSQERPYSSFSSFTTNTTSFYPSQSISPAPQQVTPPGALYFTPPSFGFNRSCLVTIVLFLLYLSNLGMFLL